MDFWEVIIKGILGLLIGTEIVIVVGCVTVLAVSPK